MHHRPQHRHRPRLWRNELWHEVEVQRLSGTPRKLEWQAKGTI
jgi:hypothetical protein